MSIVLINTEIIKPDWAFKTDLELFFSCSYAIYFHAAGYLPYLFLCLLNKLHIAKSEFRDKFRKGR